MGYVVPTPAGSAFHGLKVSADGLLTYTKVGLSDNATVNITDGTHQQSLMGTDNDAAKGTSAGWTYDQVRVDDNKLTYYMDAAGHLVAKYFGEYSYAASSDGATRNWKP